MKWARGLVHVLLFLTLSARAGQSASAKSAAEEKWAMAIEKQRSAASRNEAYIKKYGQVRTPAALEANRRCAQIVEAALVGAGGQNREVVGSFERFYLRIPSGESGTFELFFSYRGENLDGLTVSKLPRGWSIVQLNGKSLATSLTVYTDEQTGCAFHFDPGDPGETFGTARP